MQVEQKKENPGGRTTTTEEFLRLVIENSLGIPFQIVFGPSIGEGTYAYIGHGVRDLFGVPAPEFTERKFMALVEETIPLLPDIPADPAACRDKMIAGGIPHYNADIRIRIPSGDIKWLNDTSVPLRDERTGAIIGAFGILTDITARKSMEEALRESELRYRSLFDRMMDGIYRSTHEGKFVEVNQAMVRMFRFASREEMLNVDIKRELYFSPEDRESLFLDNGQEKIEIFPMRRKDGTVIWVEDHGQYIHDAAGNVTYHEGILRDVTERMQAEREIEEWKKRYELVSAASRQVVYDYNISAGTITWSGSVEQVLGYDLKEMNGGLQQWISFLHPNDREETVRRMNIARRDHSPYDVEYNFRHRNGHYVQMHDIGFFISEGGGRPDRMIGVMQDITERKQAELLQTAIFNIAHAADRAATLDELYKSVHHIIETVMPARNFYIALYDPEEDLLSFPYFIDEVDPPHPSMALGKGLTAYVLRTGKALFCDKATDANLRERGDVELIGAPSAIWIGVPLIVGEKTIGAMVVQHYTDPTAYTKREMHILEYVSSQVARAIERKAAEEKLRQSEEQFRLISENVSDMIAVLDLGGRRLYNSPSYKNLLGEPEMLRGTDSFLEIHPEDRERIRRVFSDTIATGTGQRAEYRFITRDGSIRHIESQGSVIKDRDGRPMQIVVVSRDITEKKKLEQQFLRAQRMESIGTLAGGIAHDLNNVLAPIMLSIQVLKSKISDPQILRVLETLNTSAVRGSDVVKQVLAFSRGIEGERIILQPRLIIDEIVKMSKETFPKSIEITTEFPSVLWAISADPTQVHQVLLNIFVNARDAMPFGGKIHARAENTFIDEAYARGNLDAHPGRYICITVTDSGAGIPHHILDKIFEPFFTTKEVGKGTGLGLSTVLAIVKSHNGFIEVTSEVGKGTMFRVFLPALENDPALLQPDPAINLPLGHGELILVVDDEESIREITRQTLVAHGYTALTASDGTEAIALFAQKRDQIKAVITDMMMPIMDGTTTIRALQKIDPDVVIIASSGVVPNEELMRSTGMVRRFLAKPYTTEKLLKALSELLPNV